MSHRGGRAASMVASRRSEPSASTAPAAYRTDLDGLRAVAIVLVVLFHARIAAFGGGFVGVDIFLVLSGWLITRQLVTAPLAGQRTPIMAFWARRLRRLLPAMAVMIAGVYLVSLVVLSPMEWHLVAARGAAATLYGSNLLFARSQGNYFDGSLQDSPFLHTWSLGLEQQFYVVWPVLLAGVGVVARRWSPTGRRRALGATLVAVSVISWLISVRWVTTAPDWAFYLLPSRAWEFAVGGLAALLWSGDLRPRRRVLTLLPIAGLALIGAAVLRFHAATPFPGVAALVPVAGTLAVIVGNQGTSSSRRTLRGALSTRWLRWVGRVSYSWYLWHWPFMVIGAVVVDRDTPLVRLACGVAALPVAALSYRFVEAPALAHRRLRRTGFTLGFSALAVLVLAGAAAGVDRFGSSQLAREPYRTYQAMDRSFVAQPCVPQVSRHGDRYCQAGSDDAPRTVMVVGDSHAWHWTAAFDEAGRNRAVRIIVRYQGNCSVVAGADPSCERFQQGTARLIDELDPWAVVLSDARSSRATGSGDAAGWSTAYRRLVDGLLADGRRVGHVVDGPQVGSPMICLARGRSVSSCEPRTGSALAATRTFRGAERQAYRRTDGEAVLDVTSKLCDGRRCRLRAGSTWVFAGTSHYTKPFTLTQVAAVETLLDRLLQP